MLAPQIDELYSKNFKPIKGALTLLFFVFNNSAAWLSARTGRGASSVGDPWGTLTS